MRRLAIAVSALLALAAPPAQAEFGFQAINTPDTVAVPAVPGTSSAWFGACHLARPNTDEGGFGTLTSPVPHCIDLGEQNAISWRLGNTPRWRLDPATQAGAHPDVSALFSFETAPELRSDLPGGPTFVDVDENVKDIIVRLPAGTVGSPTTVRRCSAIEVQFVPSDCPVESQIGIASLSLPLSNYTQPVYNVEARDTVTAEFIIANVAGFFNVPVTARGRTNGDYGVDTLALLIPSFLPLMGQAITIWGVPWSEQHDLYRLDSATFAKHTNQGIPLTGLPPQDQHPYQPEWGPIRPFMTSPTRCDGSPISVGIDIDSWQSQGHFLSYEVGAETLDGCEELEFEPAVKLRPTVAVADSASGLEVTLSTPQNNDPPAEIPGNPDLAHDPAEDTGAPAHWRTPAGLATAHLRNTTARLPRGTSFNPAAANGLRGCTGAQVGLVSVHPQVRFNNDLVTCPEESKLGTLKIVSPLLPDPLLGEVFAAPQNDNPFPGTLTALYMVAQDEERGLSVKLPGKVDLDPVTGQIATTFVDNPQLPFDSLELRFKSGPRGPLNTPPVCGQFTNALDLTPWSFPHSGPIASVQDPFDIAAMPNGLACVTEPEDRAFAPGFTAGSTGSQAGAATGFVADISRADGHQELSSLSFRMPPGLTANLTQTPACPDGVLAQIAGRSGLQESLAPACPAASRIGVVDTLAGAGPVPLPTRGQLYLAGPFDPDGAGPRARAPLSVAAVVPAIAGGTPGAPAFDLGNVVVRSAAHLDPVTAAVTVSGTEIPYIVGGVPLRVRRIVVDIDKPGFMLNPTSCEEASIDATLGGAGDPLVAGDEIAVTPSSRFQAGGCEALGFKPRLGIRLFGKKHRGANQRLRAVLRARPGDANIGRASVTLPRSLFLDQSHLNNICTRVQFAADACPKGSVVGTATAVTPLLNEPLQGTVFLRSSDNPLPDMVVALRGPDHLPIEVELVGRIDSHKRGIRTTFEAVPDAPVSRFVLDMFGGRRSLIENSRNLCAGAGRATVRMEAQNGRTRDFRTKLNAGCGKKAKGKGDAKRPGRPRRVR